MIAAGFSPIDRPTLIHLFETQYRRHRLAGKSFASVRNYRFNLTHFSRFLGHEATIDDLQNELILDAMQWMVETGRSVVTANKMRIHVVSLWTFLAKRGIISTFPDVQAFRQPIRSPVGWSRVQLFRLFSTLDRLPGSICGLPAADWHLCHHLFLWFTAERLTASLQFRIANLDLDTGWCLIPAETRKGKTRDLRRRLPEQVMPRFRQFVWRNPRRELLFPLDVSLSMLFLRYKAILRRAGLPSGRESMYHRMRRSAISHCIEAGGNGTKFADHSNPAITERSYVDPTIVIEEQGADILFLPFLPPNDDRPEA